MVHEMRRCTVTEFLDYYAPFKPSSASIDNAHQILVQEGHLAEVLDVYYNVTYRLASFGRQSSSNSTETQMFEPLVEVVDALGLAECRDRMGQRRQRRFHYVNCASSSMMAEIDGTSFRVDATVSTGIDLDGTAQPTLSLETAVVAKFECSKLNSERKVNRDQLVGVANHIMNDDPRRMWMYGITIEGEKMAVWYFSRSHSVKSDSFAFSENVDAFISIFLSFLFATEAQMGYDSTVHRVFIGNDIRYVYELGPVQCPAYYLTVKPIYNPRILCITGRKTRVWKAIQVTGTERDQLQPMEEGKYVALKDVWLNEGAMTERDIQEEIFRKLDSISANDYEWAAPVLKDRIKNAISTKAYKDYFMEIESDRRGAIAKAPLSTSKADANILGSKSTKRKKPESNFVPGTTQHTTSSTHTGVRLEDEGIPQRAPRDHRPKQQYRVVYKHIGTTLHDLGELPDTFSGVLDVFFALILLFLARWVHRDISTGNILMVKDPKYGRSIGKLSDLEYAKYTEDNKPTEGGLKTGTPFFMPLEIHLGRKPIFDPQLGPRMTSRPADFDRKTFDMFNPQPPPTRKKSTQQPKKSHLPTPQPPTPKFRFQHDLESLWWIITWLLMACVDHEGIERDQLGVTLEERVFTHKSLPSDRRIRFFLEPIASGITHPGLAEVITYLEEIRSELIRIYMLPTVTYKQYCQMYEQVGESLGLLVFEVRQAADVKFRPPKSKSILAAQSQARSSMAMDSADYVPGSSSLSSDGEQDGIASDDGPDEIELSEDDDEEAQTGKRRLRKRVKRDER